MHLAEGVLPLSHAAGWGVLAAPTLLWSIRGERAHRDAPMSSVVMAGVTSLLFAVTLLPLPVPVVGATSHICLTPVLSLVVGVRRIVWPTFFILLLQALFFAHGGLTTLGVNTLTLGLLGPLVTVALWSVLRRLGMANALGLACACGLGGLSVYVADAIVLAAALTDAAPPLTTFVAVLLGFVPVQVPLAVLESVASVSIVKLISKRRAELLPPSLRTLRGASAPSSATALLLLLTIGLSGCSYEGIDGTVFGVTAESAGRPPTESAIDLSQGELGLGMTIVILFGLGFLAGRSWERLFGNGRHA
ncbi:MAG: energy-coupling factor ABC transporter permease, partial [Myxococcota bacterium]